MAFCHTCNKQYHRLGIMRHRAMHRDRKEDCEISMSSGTFYYNFSKRGLPLFQPAKK